MCEKIIKDDNPTITYRDRNENERTKMRPEVAEAHELSRALLRIEQEFGMTPSARSRIQVPEKKETTSKKARFFGKPQAG